LDGFSRASWTPAYGRREQELDENLVAAPSPTPHQVAQHHVRASEHVLELTRRHQLVPIVLVRNIFDCAVSLAEHMGNESPVFPMAYVQNHMAHSRFEQRLDAVVDLALPWYINFYASWFEHAPDRIVSYEDLVLAPTAAQAEILNGLGVTTDAIQLHAAAVAMGQGEVRFNVGMAGRGDRLLTAEQRARVVRLTRHYRGIDFSPIGLGAPQPALQLVRRQVVSAAEAPIHGVAQPAFAT
jgi:hypothetical protein